ncbi:MAG: flagellar hook-basal body protein [Desulfarculus sp.]|nr:flagellar hook-basal body protein [Desulfarculus sp.]
MIDVSRAALLQQHNMDIISNNLANVNTTGFKADRPVFSEVLSREVRSVHSQGSINPTDNVLDVAIGGEGFFRVQTDKGIRLTRDGSFKMLANGTLVNSQGLKVLGAGGSPITLNPLGGQVSIDPKGNITQGTEQVGTLEVVDAADKKALLKEGANLFGTEDGKTPATTTAKDYTLTQGAVETSNVDVVAEMVQMIASFRSFESFQKVMQTVQDIDSKAINQVGRVA